MYYWNPQQKDKNSYWIVGKGEKRLNSACYSEAPQSGTSGRETFRDISFLFLVSENSNRFVSPAIPRWRDSSRAQRSQRWFFRSDFLSPVKTEQASKIRPMLNPCRGKLPAIAGYRCDLDCPLSNPDQSSVFFVTSVRDKKSVRSL